MKSLEDEVGGKLLERESSGVTPTDLGHALMKAMRPVLAAYETALAQVRRRADGITLLPDYFRTFSHPGVVFVPISDAAARWDFIVLCQRGKIPAATRALVDGLSSALNSIAQRR